MIKNKIALIVFIVIISACSKNNSACISYSTVRLNEGVGPYIIEFWILLPDNYLKDKFSPSSQGVINIDSMIISGITTNYKEYYTSRYMEQDTLLKNRFFLKIGTIDPELKPAIGQCDFDNIMLSIYRQNDSLILKKCEQ